MFKPPWSSKEPSRPDSAECWKVRTDVTTLHTDLLSARCVIDRLRRSVACSTVAQCADLKKLQDISSNLAVIASFLDEIHSTQARSGDNLNL